MEFNPSKCQLLRVMQLTLKHKPVEASYTIHGQTLELVESAKYLGVTIDSKLNLPMIEYASTVWDPHTRRNINKLEQVQRHSASRYVTGNHDYTIQHLCNGT